MRVLLASAISAIVLFFFGFAWWGVLMPILKPAKVVPDQALVNAMDSTLNESGLYFYPDYAEHSEEVEGPTAILFYESEPPAIGPMMGMGLGHMFATACLVSVFVSMLPLRSFGRRFLVVAALGLLIAVWADVGNMIWWRHPTAWTLFHFGYDVLSWVLAGAIIAAIVRPYAVDAKE